MAFCLHYPRPGVDVVIVRQWWPNGVGADGAVIHKEADLPYHQRHGVEEVGHAASHKQTEDPNVVVPQRIEEGGIAVRCPFPTEHLDEIVGKNENWEEVRPEVARLIGRSERWE